MPGSGCSGMPDWRALPASGHPLGTARLKAGGQGQVLPVEFSSAAEGRGLLDGRVEREAFEEVSASASTLGSDFGRDRVAGL